MKITFWGTSHGLPEKGRHCSCTMIEINDNIYFIDAGAPLADIMVNNDIPYEKVRAVFITHSHLDHCDGLPQFITMEKWFFKDCGTQFYLPDNVLYNGLKPIVSDRPEMSNNKIKLHIFDEGEFYDDGIIKVEAIKTEHLKNVNLPSFAFNITAGEKSLLFTGDLSDDFQDFPNIAEIKDFDLAVCELTHFSIEKAIPRLNKSKIKKIVFNHVRDDKIELLNRSRDSMIHDYCIASDGYFIKI